MKHDLDNPDFQINLTEQQLRDLTILLDVSNGFIPDSLKELRANINAGDVIALDKE